MLISVVLSFYNEDEVIPELVRRLRAVFRKMAQPYELIFVNDASTDSSLERLEEAAQGRTDIKIVNMSRNWGVSECVMAGLRFATGDAVIYMDADLQDPPELIPELVMRWDEGRGADVVHTVRLTRKGENPVKMWITKVGYRVLKYASNIDLPVNAGDFKLLGRRVVDELARLDEKRPFMRGLVVWVGFKQVYVHYDREARYSGKTKFKVYSSRVIRNFLDSALISFSDVPLKVSLLVGFLISSGAFGYLVLIFIMKFLGWSLPGWSAIMATILVLGGIQLITIGVLGLYINGIYNESKKRPNFIVKDTIGFEAGGAVEFRGESKIMSGGVRWTDTKLQ
ncbi:MAG: glycosyl transferase [Deltaproteobacteria bacterium GWA2_55_10]|nr:MAG: glycosyl transferase [Deltaproteobacteria bacterium GWA2_55_10]